jgi:hypothetical protein
MNRSMQHSLRMHLRAWSLSDHPIFLIHHVKPFFGHTRYFLRLKTQSPLTATLSGRSLSFFRSTVLSIPEAHLPDFSIFSRSEFPERIPPC